MDKDQEVWDKLKKTYLTTEQKMDLIRELNERQRKHEWEQLLKDLRQLHKELKDKYD